MKFNSFFYFLLLKFNKPLYKPKKDIDVYVGLDERKEKKPLHFLLIIFSLFVFFLLLSEQEVFSIPEDFEQKKPSN